MNDADFLPNDLGQCQRLLLAAFREATERERRLADAQQRVADAEVNAQAAELRAVAAERRASATQQQVTDLGRVLDETAASFEQLRQEHAATLEELAWYKRWVHGRRSERLADGEGQGHLFDLAAPAAEAASDLELTEPLPAAVPRPRRRRRELDLSRLPHHRHESELSAAEKICDCCGRPKDRIGEDMTTVVEHVPPRLEVHEYVRGKYACRYCKNGVSTPPPPPRPIARGIAGPGLVAEIIVSKFNDHLPLYRLEDIFVRCGIHFPRSTLCDWVAAAADLLQPLYDLQRQLVVQSPVLWTDDTPVTVLVGGEEGSRQGRFWAYVGEEYPYSVYDFSLSRRRDGPQSFLRTFKGYLHADAYSGYDAIYLGSNHQIVEVACWAHARRKFFDAAKSYPRQSHQVLEWIGQLYDIEDRARDLSVEARYDLRRAEAERVLDKLEVYLAELAETLLPKSALAKAVTYARNQWQALRRYTADGRLTMDNNTSERTLRHQAIGRKNWLFLGSESAGPRAAVLYTILAGAKRHRLEPWTYVRELLMRMHADDNRLEEMLPDRWAAQHPESVLTHRLDESRDKAARKRERRRHRRARLTHPSR
jgi:transposase